MTQQENNILSVKLRGVTISIALCILTCTAAGVWTASSYYYGVLAAIEKSNSANAVQDTRLSNLEKRTDTHDDVIKQLAQRR